MSRSPDSSNDVDVDVVVVGAGFAGLSAAERLVSLGRTVRVLEGRDRVGGRSLSGEVAGVKVDFGATWVSPRHTAVRSLAERVGCTTTEQFAEGKNVLWMSGRRRTYGNTIPKVSPAALLDMARIQAALNTLVDSIDVEAAWSSPRARELDSVSFGEWLDKKHALSATRALMAIVSKVQWGSPPGDVSMLHALRYIRAAGGVDHMLDVEGGQQQHRYVETTQEIALRVAERLGSDVVLGRPVDRITQHQDGVSVSSVSETIRASYAIVTTAPSHRAAIEFDPPLPERMEGLSRTWRLGNLSKAFVAYDTPFWRHDGCSGEAVTDTGAVFITFDVSPKASGPGILMAFCDPRVFDALDARTRHDRVIDQLVDLFGERARNPIDYVDHCWSAESFAPGGPNPAVAPYATTTYGPALTETHGRVHWAGTETAGEWAGCMNGAVLTGQRAAERVAALLPQKSPVEAVR